MFTDGNSPRPVHHIGRTSIPDFGRGGRRAVNRCGTGDSQSASQAACCIGRPFLHASQPTDPLADALFPSSSCLTEQSKRAAETQQFNKASETSA